MPQARHACHHATLSSTTPVQWDAVIPTVLDLWRTNFPVSDPSWCANCGGCAFMRLGYVWHGPTDGWRTETGVPFPAPGSTWGTPHQLPWHSSQPGFDPCNLGDCCSNL